MSEAMSADERARLREMAGIGWEFTAYDKILSNHDLTALLDEVDRLTEALEAAERRAEQWMTEAHDASVHIESLERIREDTATDRRRAERAEADLDAIRKVEVSIRLAAAEPERTYSAAGWRQLLYMAGHELRALLSAATTGGE